jgi:hypothetical protein
MAFALPDMPRPSEKRYSQVICCGKAFAYAYKHVNSAQLVLREDNAYGWKYAVGRQDFGLGQKLY